MPGVVGAALLASAFASHSAQAQTPAAQAPRGDEVALALSAETAVLPNGLTVLLAPDRRARLVTIAVSYAAGAGDDPDGLRGLAHLTEHLVASRTKHVDDPFRLLESVGGSQFNATTALDTTTYFETVPPERLESALWLESERMGYAANAVTDARVDAERALVANEARDSDGMLTGASRLGWQELFPAWHPYAQPVDSTGDFSSIRARDVLAFLRTFYQPSNAALAIAGAFDRDAALALVTRYFGDLPSSAPPVRPLLPVWSNPQVRLRVLAGARHDWIEIKWRTPELGTEADAALDLVALALAGPGNERLDPALVATHMATNVSARQAPGLRASTFTIDIQAAPGANLTETLAVTERAIDGLSRSVTEDEAARARLIARHAVLTGLETTQQRAARLLASNRAGRPIGPGFDWGLGRHSALVASDLAHAAATWLAPSRRVVTVVLANPHYVSRGVLLDRTVLAP